MLLQCVAVLLLLVAEGGAQGMFVMWLKEVMILLHYRYSRL